MVRLSAPILTWSFAPAFSGRIEVDIIAEDLPAGDPRQQATLGNNMEVSPFLEHIHANEVHSVKCTET